ncbi:glycosyltransferase [Jeotgalibacillus aurantiacus]|uniref:glycosyltransferase n=1 Tax=Jeotgalibacillus aurantiacus TaxID=2763266 RepID=UPI001D0A957A|nr:glycosyltransferase [Jeotgalibacillus aurantiacus]
MTKKIVVITNMYPSQEHPTFGIFVKNQVEALKAEGYDVKVLAITDPRSGKFNALRKYGIWALHNLLYLLTNGKKTDIVHAHYLFPSGVFAMLYKKLFKTRMIVTSHGGDLDKMARISPVIHSMTKKILHESDRAIAVGHQLHETMLQEFKVPEEKTLLLNMGVDRSVFKPSDKNESKGKLGWSENSRNLLFVGNMIEQKGLLDLIAAADQLKQSGDFEQTSIHLIGANKSPAFLSRLQSEISKRNLDDVVRYVGTKNQQEIAVWMSASDAFILPSHIEGFGLVALEAMSCGTPVIASRTGGLPYLLDQESGHLIEPKNPASLAEGVRTLLNDTEYRERLRENGFRKAELNDQKRVIKELKRSYFPNGG